MNKVRPGDVILWDLKRPPHTALAHAATVICKTKDVLLTLEGHITAPTEIVAYTLKPAAKKAGGPHRIPAELTTLRPARVKPWDPLHFYWAAKIQVVRRKNYEK